MSEAAYIYAFMYVCVCVYVNICVYIFTQASFAKLSRMTAW